MHFATRSSLSKGQGCLAIAAARTAAKRGLRTSSRALSGSNQIHPGRSAPRSGTGAVTASDTDDDAAGSAGNCTGGSAVNCGGTTSCHYATPVSAARALMACKYFACVGRFSMLQAGLDIGTRRWLRLRKSSVAQGFAIYDRINLSGSSAVTFKCNALLNHEPCRGVRAPRSGEEHIGRGTSARSRGERPTAGGTAGAAAVVMVAATAVSRLRPRRPPLCSDRQASNRALR